MLDSTSRVFVTLSVFMCVLHCYVVSYDVLLWRTASSLTVIQTVLEAAGVPADSSDCSVFVMSLKILILNILCF